MKYDLWRDSLRYAIDFDGKRLSPLQLLLRSPGFQSVAAYRLGRWLWAGATPLKRILRAPLWVVYGLAKAWVLMAFDIDLALSAEIGAGFYVGHFGGVRIRECRIGEWCSIAQETTIAGSPTDNGKPHIGNRVWTGAHVQITGPVTVGDGATIAVGSTVASDVPAGALVAGRPARVVQIRYDNSEILNVSLDKAMPAPLVEYRADTDTASDPIKGN